jgi:hypothetical protein
MPDGLCLHCHNEAARHPQAHMFEDSIYGLEGDEENDD